MKLFKNIPSLAALSLVACLMAPVSSALAQLAETPPAAPPAIAQAIKSKVEALLRGKSTVTAVRMGPAAGLYEVQIGQDLFYADEKGEVIIQGQAISLQSGVNLTEARLDVVRAVDFRSLPLKLAVKSHGKKGATPEAAKRTIAVFEDPYCPPCRRMRAVLAEQDHVTVYTFLLPGLRPESLGTAKKAWCAKDPAAAWDAWMIEGKEPGESRASCVFPEKELFALAEKLAVESTPTVIWATGQRQRGALTPSQLEQAFAAGQGTVR